MIASSSQSRRAFTLIEVLVSLAIFALAAVVLSAAYLNVISGYQTRDELHTQEAGWQLARILVTTEPDLTKVEAGGNLKLPDQSTITWSADVQPTNLADLFAVTLHVQASGENRWDKEGRLMLLRPAWSDPGDRDRLREDSRQRIAQRNHP